MSNFKSGSGNLDFGGGDEDEDPDEGLTQPSETESSEGETPSGKNRQTESTVLEPESPGGTETPDSTPATEEYPYFVRRSNVGDERDVRLEIHVRETVAEGEAQYRNELAEQLDVSEVSKTDAREFALLAAYQHPERVAELMKSEGFGALR